MRLLTEFSGETAPCWRFPDECCFQVIYFVPNIPFRDPIEQVPGPVWELVG